MLQRQRTVAKTKSQTKETVSKKTKSVTARRKKIRSKKRESHKETSSRLLAFLLAPMPWRFSIEKAGENRLAKRRRTTRKTTTDVKECCGLKLETPRCAGARVMTWAANEK